MHNAKEEYRKALDQEAMARVTGRANVRKERPLVILPLRRSISRSRISNRKKMSKREAKNKPLFSLTSPSLSKLKRFSRTSRFFVKNFSSSRLNNAKVEGVEEQREAVAVNCRVAL